MPPIEARHSVVDSPFAVSLPYSFVEKASRLAAVALLIISVPVLGIIVGPVSLMLAFAAEDVRLAIADKPLAVSMLALGLIAWSGLFLLPLQRLIKRFCTTRHVQIAAERVCVEESSLFGVRAWSVPLAEFRGLAHVVRATRTSGVRHELVLVHRDRQRTVRVHVADRISQATIDGAAHLLKLPQVPAQELFRVAPPSSSLPAIPVAGGQPA
jgi:hypothetical protein